MSQIPPSLNVITSPKVDFCLQLGLSHFERNITNNFRLINESMLRQTEEISNLKNKYEQLADIIINQKFRTKQVKQDGSNEERISPYKRQQLSQQNNLPKQQFNSVSMNNHMSLRQQSKEVQIQTISQKVAEASSNLTFMHVRQISMQKTTQKQKESSYSQQLILNVDTQARFESSQVQVDSQNKIEKLSRDLNQIQTSSHLSKGQKQILSSSKKVLKSNQPMLTQETANSTQPQTSSNFTKEKKTILSNSKKVLRQNQPILAEKTINAIKPQSNTINKPSINTAAVSKQQVKSLQNQILVSKSDKQGQIQSSKQNKQNSVQTPISAIISNPMIEAKVFQLFERVRLLQEKQLMISNQNLKHFKQIEFSLQGNNKFLQKYGNIETKFEDEVQKLRNQLSEYKLKKQAKLLKAINSNNLNQSNLSNDSMDYIAQKLQFLLKHIKQVLPRRSYEEDRLIMEQNIQNLRTKVNKNVSEQLFNDRLKNLQLKIYQTIVQYMNTKMGSSTIQSQGGSTILDEFVAKGNNQFYQKVDLHSQKLDELQNDIDLLKANTEMNRRQRLLFQSNIGEEFATEIERTNVLEHRTQETERQIQQSNKRLNQKHSEAEDQIADCQELIDQLTQRMKSITLFSKPTDSNQVSSNTQTDGMNEPGQRSVVQIQNDLHVQKKKLSKLISKVQSVKDEMFAVRDALMREIESLKMNMERKADWQSFKKTINYMDERMKETKMMIQTVVSSLPTNEGGQSLAVKKSWTCLLCDKQIKNYEGKLSEVKFTSMFPIKESPRIGGYFKQQQAAQEYKQVYLNNSPLGNVRRRPSLKPVNLKQQEQK